MTFLPIITSSLAIVVSFFHPSQDLFPFFGIFSLFFDGCGLLIYHRRCIRSDAAREPRPAFPPTPFFGYKNDLLSTLKDPCLILPLYSRNTTDGIPCIRLPLTLVLSFSILAATGCLDSREYNSDWCDPRFPTSREAWYAVGSLFFVGAFFQSDWCNPTVLC